MKKILMGVGLAALLAGCASNDNGMGGTSDQSNQSHDSMKTDTFNQKNSSDQYNNNATQGTDTSTAPNGSAPGQGTNP